MRKITLQLFLGLLYASLAAPLAAAPDAPATAKHASVISGTVTRSAGGAPLAAITVAKGASITGVEVTRVAGATITGALTAASGGAAITSAVVEVLDTGRVLLLGAFVDGGLFPHRLFPHGSFR